MAELTPGHPRIFGWESAHRDDHRRVSRKRLQLAADLLLFGLVPVAAPVVYWSSGSVGIAPMTLSVLETALITVEAVQIVLYADLNRP